MQAGLAAAITGGLLFLGRAGLAAEVGPGSDWCQALRALPPGEELVLQPGDYTGPCTVTRGGVPGAPLVIRAKDPAHRPRIVYPDRATNVLNIRASHVLVRGLEFGPTQTDVDAIRIHSGDDVTIEDCRFVELGSIAIVANSQSLRGLTVRRNEVLRSKSTAMYFGCHDGMACIISELLIEQNYIDGIAAPDPDIGYGIQVKLNSTGTIADNVIVNTKGPGIMVYGARDPGLLSFVERNFVAGSRTSSGIVVGGGPVVIRNNIAAGGSAEAGIGLEDYGRRGLLRGIVITHNTVHGNRGAGIAVPAEGRLDVKLLNNAVHAAAGTRVLPVGRVGTVSLGNVNCTWVPCFVRPDERDFSLLDPQPGLVVNEAWTVTDDYFGRSRGSLPNVGAIEQGGEPIALGIKSARP
jgi:Right handed beta helix region